MTDNRHLIESITLTNGKVITLNIYCKNDNEFDSILANLDSKYEYTYVRANHNTEVEGNKAKTKAGEWVEYTRVMDKDEAMEIIANIDEIDQAKFKAVYKACIINGHYTTTFCQNYLNIETYLEGWYLKASGTRSSVNIFINKDRQVIRKPLKSTLILSKGYNVESHAAWRKIEDKGEKE